MQNLDIKLETAKQEVFIFVSSPNFITVRHFDKETHEFLSEYKLINDEKNNSKLAGYKSLNAVIKYAEKHQISDILKELIAESDTALPSPNHAELPSNLACEGNLITTPSHQTSVCGVVSPPYVAELSPTDTSDTLSTEMPLNTSLVFKLHSDEFGVTLRHDYSSDYITITKIKNLRPVFEIGLWYSPEVLALLLTARTPSTLFALAQKLEVDYGIHLPLEVVA